MSTLFSNPVKPAEVQIEESWKTVLADEFSKPYFSKIKAFLVEQKKAGKVIYPPGPLIFNAFNHTPFEAVRVVIIGQDPYHNPGQAMGLCFSVPEDIKIPASLKNIYKEIHDDIGLPFPSHGDLTKWAEQGVFLLNTVLTVEKKRPGSHRKIGWQQFTDAVIAMLSAKKEGLVFLLWGNYARSKIGLIDEMKHYVLEAVHPSPLAGNHFLGCRHFSRANALLAKQGYRPIDWNVS